MDDIKSAKWTFFSPANEQVRLIATELKISDTLANILWNRNLRTTGDVRTFLSPSMEHLPSAERIPGSVAAADIIYAGIRAKKKFMVYGDYDVDGVTGTALLVNTLRSFNADVDYYIPHRYSEGYGLNIPAIENFARKGIEIIVTVDCAVSNIREIRLAREKGIEVVVIDHHTPPKNLPPASAIVNPKLQHDIHNPYYHLSGVGVAYKFVERLYHVAGISTKQIPEHYLELVALGTITDIVPLLGENRTLTTFGLMRMNRSTNPGLNQLKKVALIKKTVNTYSIGFMLGPRLNAAGRMAHASLAVELLLTENEYRAAELAEQLNTINNERKTSGRAIKDTITEFLATSEGNNEASCIVIARENWNPGIIGIVASQIANQFSRPTVLIAIRDGKGRGSVRSVPGIDIYTPLAKCSHLFLEFGGHKEAAGFEIKTSDIEEFKQQFTALLDNSLSPDDLQKTIAIDMQLKPDAISVKLAKELQKLEPFGQANPEPVFFSNDLFPIDFRLVGDGAHLNVTFSDGINMIDAIGFGMADQVDKLKKNTVEILYHLKLNTWKDKPTIQLQLIDIRNP